MSDTDGGRHDATRALAERIARAATSVGFTADLGYRLGTGPRDWVLIHGSGATLGCAPQLTPVSAPVAVERSRRAAAGGVTPLWTVTDPAAPVIDRAPWARVQRMPWQRYLDAAEVPVLGGVRTLFRERCDPRRRVCPDRRSGRRCRGWHEHWEPRQVPRLDDLIIYAARADVVPVKQHLAGGRACYFWVRAADLADAESPPELDRPHDPLDAVVRRVGGGPPPRYDGPYLDWSDAMHWGEALLPCRVCGRAAYLRDDTGRPCHKVCAENEQAGRPED